jgi:tetratricopeptide (TPR) repeat protein
MIKLLKRGIAISIVSRAISPGLAHAFQAPIQPTVAVQISISEACTFSPANRDSRGNPDDAAVSVTRLLTPGQAERAVDRAERSLAANRFEDTARELNAALAIYPKSAVAWCLFGRLHEQQLQLETALSDYSKALAVDARFLPAYLGLSRIAFRAQKWREVIRLADQLLSLDSVGYPSAYLYKAVAQYNSNDFAAAEASARRFRAFDRFHERPQINLLLGDILARQGDFAGAAQEDRDFLLMVPDAADSAQIKHRAEVFQELSRRNAHTERQASTVGTTSNPRPL